MRIKFGRPLLIRHIAAMCDGVAILSKNANCLQALTHLTTDSREILPGDLFVALSTEKDDGHRYIEEAVKKGASTVLCSQSISFDSLDFCMVLCEDTMTALARFAKNFTSPLHYKTIAVTGSVGKTTTRRYLTTVLQQKYRVFESCRNYNNMLGNCLMMLSMPTDTEIFVTECGMDAPGQIRALSELLTPDFAVITNIGISHLEKLGSREAICHAKLEIASGLKNGHLFCNGDDDMLQYFAPKNTVFVYTRPSASPGHKFNISSHDIYGVTFDYSSPERKMTSLHIPSVGIHTMKCAAFAVVLGTVLNLSDREIRHGLAQYQEENMRQSTYYINQRMIIFDAYNACPTSMEAACDVLKTVSLKTEVHTHILLGDMYELGTFTEESHRVIGALFAKNHVSHLHFWGNYAHLYKEGAEESGIPSQLIHLYRKETPLSDLAKQVVRHMKSRDVLLLKGSRGMKMELLIPYLKEELMKENSEENEQ